jgi:hypothetical protein
MHLVALLAGKNDQSPRVVLSTCFRIMPDRHAVTILNVGMQSRKRDSGSAALPPFRDFVVGDIK